ncbi:MAG: hypothetical protein M3Z26_17715 [Bacteroidota bacterium]|nr:hypothetical protein [Bacteroidota bacterium]
MKILLFILLIMGIFSCENHRFDSDKRQIMAKDEIQSKFRRARDFDITAFKEEVVQNEADTNFKKQIRYTMDFVYLDSNKILQQKKGIVLFTPDGDAIISTQITDR